MPKISPPTTTPTWTPLLLNILPSTTEVPIEMPPAKGLRLLGGDSETNRGPRAISPSPSARAQLGGGSPFSFQLNPQTLSLSLDRLNRGSEDRGSFLQRG